MGGGAEAIERALEGDMFLKALKGVWDDHTGSMHKLTAVLRYMVSALVNLTPRQHAIDRDRTRSTHPLPDYHLYTISASRCFSSISSGPARTPYIPTSLPLYSRKSSSSGMARR